MENEKLNLNEEENNYEPIDIIENTDEIIFSETVQVVEIDEPELFTVDTDSAFPALGDQNDLRNHAKLNNRELPEQHPITAITGLREELDGIHALKTVESDKRGYANYYIWKDEQLPPDRVGYFVSIHTNDHKISIIRDSETEVFGVTVDSAGFVGWQENKPRGGECALVATTGVVKVKCEKKVVAGNYIMPSGGNGYATSTGRKYGYYVISIDMINDERYAVISLDSTMNQIYKLSEDIDDIEKKLVSVESKAHSAINAAQVALKNSLEPSINSALQNSKDALESAGAAMDAITDFTDSVGGEIDAIKTKVDVVSDQIVIAVQDEVDNRINDLNNGASSTSATVEKILKDISDIQDDIDESVTEIEGLKGQIIPLVEFKNEAYTTMSGLVASTEDNTNQLAAISQCLSNDFETKETWTADLMSETDKIFYIEDEEVYYYYTNEGWTKTPYPSDAGLSETIASMRQKINENEAMVEDLVSYSSRDYETLEKWDKYVVVDDFDSAIADTNLIYYDINENKYYQCNFNSLENGTWVVISAPSGFTSLTEEDKETIYYAEDTNLYYYYDNGWHSTEVLSVANLVKSIALTKQLANKNESSIETITSRVDGHSETIAATQQIATDNEAAIRQLTSYVQNNYTKLDEPWDETDKDVDVIYYAKDPTDNLWKYWYYKKDKYEPGWVGSVNPSDARLSSSLASVESRVSENESSITSITLQQSDMRDAITKLEQSSGEDGASTESLVMNINKYTVGRYSQAYGLTLEEAMELLRDGTVFAPTIDTAESYDRLTTKETQWSDVGKHRHLIYYAMDNSQNWKYWQWNNDTESWDSSDSIESTFTEPREFMVGSYYTWDKKEGVWVDGDGSFDFWGWTYYPGSDGDYLFCENSYLRIEGKFDIENTNSDNIYYAQDETGDWKYWRYWYINKNDLSIKGWVKADNYSDLLPITISSRNNIVGVDYELYYVMDEAKYYYLADGEWMEVKYTPLEEGALYRWNTDDEEYPYWQMVAQAETNTLSRTISQVRQSVFDTAAEFSAGLTNVKGDLADITLRLDDLGSTYVTTTTFNDNMAQIEQAAYKDEARLSMIVSSGFETQETWFPELEHQQDINTVYYVEDEEAYRYWDGTQWVKTEDVKNANIAPKIHSAGIITSINDDESEIQISGDKININGVTTFKDASGVQQTIIDGSKITTGIIDANRLNVGKETNGIHNLLTNGDFSNGAWNKHSNMTISLSTSDVPNGAGAKKAILKIKGDVNGTSPYINQTISIIAGQNYTGSFWLKRESEADVRVVRLDFVWKSDSGTIKEEQAIKISDSSTNWARKSITKTAPSGATKLEFRCVVMYSKTDTALNDLGVHVAGFMLEKGSQLHDWDNGTTALSSSSVIIDPTGIDIYNGAFKIYDKNNNAILTINDDNNQSMYISGNIQANTLIAGNCNIMYSNNKIGFIDTGVMSGETLRHFGIMSESGMYGIRFGYRKQDGGLITSVDIPNLASSSDKYSLIARQGFKCVGDMVCTGTTTLNGLSVTGSITCSDVQICTKYSRPSLVFTIDGKQYTLLIDPGDPPRLCVVDPDGTSRSLAYRNDLN